MERRKIVRNRKKVSEIGQLRVGVLGGACVTKRGRNGGAPLVRKEGSRPGSARGTGRRVIGIYSLGIIRSAGPASAGWTLLGERE